ncbi:MAG: xanthine dehydrogenase accessory protein XdhC [Duganella sp.]
MNDWLTAFGDQAAVLVTVAMVQGSVPRAPGARMLVTRSRADDTIGGGHLELCAIDLARAMLDDPGMGAARLERYALGPTLGQCCGGVVFLSLEVVDDALRAVLATLRRRRNQDSWRLSAIDGAPAALLLDADGAVIAGQGAMPALAFTPGQETATRIVSDADGRRWLLDPCPAPRAHLLLFGAGHVGAAIVHMLGQLPCTVHWIDERADMFPDAVPANITVEATDTPEALVAAAPAGASYLVLTHSHALDQRLSEAILARAEVGWFGLIGSATKRVQFERRLAARGLPPERIAAMVCPIGLPGIRSKLPAAIAASVCAQLLMVWEAAAHGMHSAPSGIPATTS